MEHRWGQRVLVDVPIRLVAGPFSGRSARLTNLSISGGCIRSRFELRLLSRIELAVELPARFTPATPLLMAYVTRNFEGGVGIEWCEFAPPAISELIRSATPRRYGYPRRAAALAKAQAQVQPGSALQAPPGARSSHAAQPFLPAPRSLLKHGS